VGRQVGIYGDIRHDRIYYCGGETEMKKLAPFFIMLVLLLFFSNTTFADLNSNELIEKGKEYDGRMVAFTGEVIGDPMSRGAYMWLNVKDKDNAMGIRVKKDILPIIKYHGSYNYIGDEVTIRGIFNRSCSEHGGDMDIHAASIIVLKAGHSLEHHLPAYKLIMAFFSLFTAGFAFFLYRRKGRKLKNA
jgi:hypothetical protein